MINLQLVGFRADIIEDVGQSNLQLIFDGGYPVVSTKLGNLFWASQVKTP